MVNISSLPFEIEEVAALLVDMSKNLVQSDCLSQKLASSL